MTWRSCDEIGIGGGCGYDCPLFLDGECELQAEMIEGLVDALREAEALLEKHNIEMEKKRTAMYCECGQRAMLDSWMCADCRTTDEGAMK